METFGIVRLRVPTSFASCSIRSGWESRHQASSDKFWDSNLILTTQINLHVKVQSTQFQWHCSKSKSCEYKTMLLLMYVGCSARAAYLHSFIFAAEHFLATLIVCHNHMFSLFREIFTLDSSSDYSNQWYFELEKEPIGSDVVCTCFKAFSAHGNITL